MSTQINVTVGSGGLSDKARQLQTAARQAQLEKQRQQRIEAQGQAQRNAALAAQGKAPDGSPLYGPGFKQPDIEHRPAANRTGTADKFGYFYIQQDAFVEGQLGFYVSCGDNSANHFIPYPAVADFSDLLLPYLAGGELTGERRPGFSPPPFYTLQYDSLGRLLGSFAPSGDAVVWKPDYNTFWSFTTGLVTSVFVKAIYRTHQSSFYQVLPAGNGAAVLCIGMRTVKTATISAVRTDRDKYYDRSPDPECIFDISPENYKEFTFDRRHVEQFFAIYVSNTEIKYIGEAPSGWVNQVKSLPFYSEVSDASMTSFSKQIFTANYYNTPFNSTCPVGDEPVYPFYVYDKLYNNIDMAPLISNYQKGYKLLGGGPTALVANTPAAFEVINNYQAFVASSPSPITDAFIKNYVPSFAGDSLTWRYGEPSADFTAFTPYSYQGTPPTSWSSSPQILDNFPTDWKKSGKIIENMYGYNGQVVWDWNNPNYCRQQLLALGFTTADLTP